MTIGPGATPDTTVVAATPQPTERPADPNLATKAWGELRGRAQKLGADQMGWHKIRTGKIDDWLRDADPTKKQEAGFLKQEDQGKGVTKWEDNTETREYLTNAQRRAVELARQGVGEFSSKLGLSAEQAAEKPFDEIVKEAANKGLNVDQNTEEGVETLDYLRNAHEYAKEQSVKAAEDEASQGLAAATEISATIVGIEIPEAAHQMLEVLASGGDVPKKIQELGEVRIVTPAEGQSLSEQEKAKTAFGYDLQIAGMQLEQQQIAEIYQKARGKKQQNLAGKYKDLGEQVKQLVEKRSQLPVPNQVQEFVKSLGIADEAAEKNPLGALSDTISQAIASKDARQVFVTQLRDQVAKGNLKEEDVNTIEKFLNSQALQKFMKDKALFGAKAVGGLGALMLIMMWIASKEKQGGMG